MYFVNHLIALASVFMLATSARLPKLHARYNSWTDFPASANLGWRPCPRTVSGHTKFLCMRLEVPLDYEAPEQGTTTIAFIKSPALKPSKETKEVLINFGGPGATGVDSLVDTIQSMRKIIGHSHNIISFDPRGIGYSGPSIDCFQRDTVASNLLLAKLDYDKPLFLPQATTEILKHADEWGNLCQQTLNSTARYIGTYAVARDMLNFVELQAALDGKNHAETVLNFLGMSYGTALGATFATLYPERTGRMILDGVVHDEYYYAGHFQDLLVGFDQTIRAFFEQCSTAGPERCRFWAESPAQVEARLDKLLEGLRRYPIQVKVGSIPVDKPVLITDATIRRKIREDAYTGHYDFSHLATMLEGLETRKKKTVNRVRSAMNPPPCSNCTGQDRANLFRLFPRIEEDPFHTYAIVCTDADARYNISTPAIYEQILQQDMKISKYAGDLVIKEAALCRKWPFRPPPSQRFNGTFGGRTKNPILILNNKYDVATPLESAQRLETQFEGAVLLTQDAANHCALSVWSKCTDEYIKQYLNNGILPPRQTVCLPDTKPSFYKSWWPFKSRRSKSSPLRRDM